MPFPLVGSAGVILLQQEGMKQGCFCFHVSLSMLSPACQRLTEFCQKHQSNSHQVSGQAFKLSNIPHPPRVVRLLDNVCKGLQNTWIKSNVNVKSSTKSASRILNICVRVCAQVGGCASVCMFKHIYICIPIYIQKHYIQESVAAAYQHHPGDFLTPPQNYI